MKKAIIVLVIGIIDTLRNFAIIIESFNFSNDGGGYYTFSIDENTLISLLISGFIIALGVIMFKEYKVSKEK